jgi:hypothetical protein
VSTAIGIDPSLDGTGLAYGDELLTVRGAGDERLRLIYRAVVTATGGTGLAIVEDLPTHGMGAGKTGMAQGVVRLALLHEALPYVLVAPATLKKYATGRGNATKPDMRVELLKRTGLDLRDDNQVDAWWLRALGMDLKGAPLLTMPQSHRACLAKLPAAVWS